MSKKNIALFLAILIVAFVLRFYKVTEIPPSLNWDEVSIGYNAYSVLHTGRDEWGKLLPLSFRAYGDYKLPIYIYADIPFIAVFGLSELGVRLLSVLSGVGIVFVIFLILKNLTKNILASLVGMFIGAILPWLIILSRIGLEANLALFLISLSIYFFLRGLEKKWFLTVSAFILGLSLFTYNSSRVIVPFLVTALILFFGKKIKNKKEGYIAGIVIALFVIVVVPLALFTDSSARFGWTTILDEGAISSINQQRRLSSLPAEFKSLVYNKVTYFVTVSAENYASYYNPDFLFKNGGSNYQFSVPGSGLLFWALIPLFLAGIIQIFLQRKDWQLLIFIWLLIAPLPGSITRDAPHALRSLFLIPPIILISGLGIDFLMKRLKQMLFKFIMSFLVILMLLQFYSFWINYSGNYRQDYSWSWQYGLKQAVNFVSQYGESYDKIIVTKKYGEPHEFLLFYLKYDPLKYQTNSNLIRYKRSDWYWVDGFDKFEFINDWEVKDKVLGRHNVLLITNPGNYPVGAEVVKTINYLDGKGAFEIVAIK